MSTDEMTGKLSAYASSPTINPTKRMSFPYNKVQAWLAVGCDDKSEWAYIGFNQKIILSDTRTQSKYDSFVARIKWKDQLKNVAFTQDWGSKFIHFRDDNEVIAKINASSTVLLELQLYGQQPLFLKFSLKGSTNAINKIRNTCSK